MCMSVCMSVCGGGGRMCGRKQLLGVTNHMAWSKRRRRMDEWRLRKWKIVNSGQRLQSSARRSRRTFTLTFHTHTGAHILPCLPRLPVCVCGYLKQSTKGKARCFALTAEGTRTAYGPSCLLWPPSDFPFRRLASSPLHLNTVSHLSRSRGVFAF